MSLKIKQIWQTSDGQSHETKKRCRAACPENGYLARLDGQNIVSLLRIVDLTKNWSKRLWPRPLRKANISSGCRAESIPAPPES